MDVLMPMMTAGTINKMISLTSHLNTKILMEMVMETTKLDLNQMHASQLLEIQRLTVSVALILMEMGTLTLTPMLITCQRTVQMHFTKIQHNGRTQMEMGSVTTLKDSMQMTVLNLETHQLLIELDAKTLMVMDIQTQMKHGQLIMDRTRVFLHKGIPQKIAMVV